jgi:hypothetical protein
VEVARRLVRKLAMSDGTSHTDISNPALLRMLLHVEALALSTALDDEEVVDHTLPKEGEMLKLAGDEVEKLQGFLLDAGGSSSSGGAKKRAKADGGGKAQGTKRARVAEGGGDGPASIHAMTVPELKDKCRELGLPVSGTKKVRSAVWFLVDARGVRSLFVHTMVVYKCATSAKP